MDERELDRWFAANKEVMETAYTAAEQPWQQSGFGLHTPRTYADWEALRRPIADAVDAPGAFLDIGCANGYLLECVLRWTGERNIEVVPYGLDLSERLVELARKRLPAFADHFYAGNAWDWQPPRRFDYVRTELVYVPDELHRAFVQRILDEFLHPGGCLLAAEYRSRRDPPPLVPVDRYLTDLGLSVKSVRHGMHDGKELTRIAVVRQANAVRNRPDVSAP